LNYRNSCPSCLSFTPNWRKFLENSRHGVRLKTAMMQVEAVLQMLQPGFNVKSISAKRRNKGFKRGTLVRSAVDVIGGRLVSQ
jgi:hypothetical protein